APAPSIPRDGLEDLVCVYCGEGTGAEVTKHLERCYRQTNALRNERLDSATLRPSPEERRKLLLEGSHPRGGGSASDGLAVVPSTAASSTAIGRKLLTRRVAYANFDALPDPDQFQLHPDLLGWKDSPSRLDFLYKELVRQRNAAVSFVFGGEK
ncbi:unnamed protein product, partial [Laminaria digitata]